MTSLPPEPEPSDCAPYPRTEQERAFVCAHCGGRSRPGDRLVPVPGPGGLPWQWRMCRACEVVGRTMAADITILADVLDSRAPERPDLPALAIRLATQPPRHAGPAIEIGWAAFRRLIPALAPYYQSAPHVSPDDPPGRAWHHLPAEAVARAVELLDRAASLREPATPLDAAPVACGQCGGPAVAGDRVLLLVDQYGKGARWAVCSTCDTAWHAPTPDAAVLADLLAHGVPQRPELPGRVLALAAMAGGPSGVWPVGLSALNERVGELGAYYRVPGADPARPSRGRWTHVSQDALARAAAEVDRMVRDVEQTDDREVVGSCEQCGGPAARGGQMVTVASRYGGETVWTRCAVCTDLALRPDSDAAVLADVLAARCPDRLGLAELAVRLAAEPPPHPCAAVEVGWAGFVRRVDGLGPFHRVFPEAHPGMAPGARWWHLSSALVGRVGDDVERIAALRVPAAYPGGRGCSWCSTTVDLPGRWGALEGKPACGACMDRAARARGVPVHLDPARMGDY